MKFNHPSGHKDTEEDYFSGEASEAEEGFRFFFLINYSNLF